jgi:hypothetical protein
MYDFLIGCKTGPSRSLAVYLFDHNSLCHRPLPVATSTPPRRASLAQDRHLIYKTTSNCIQNERISHGHRSNAKSL